MDVVRGVFGIVAEFDHAGFKSAAAAYGQKAVESVFGKNSRIENRDRESRNPVSLLNGSFGEGVRIQFGTGRIHPVFAKADVMLFYGNFGGNLFKILGPGVRFDFIGDAEIVRSFAFVFGKMIIVSPFFTVGTEGAPKC